ncbi:DUF4954 family protein [Compostibacter hankyongensis]|uniref:DUF4954 family protein n=1 Tax=Compostibacter hankyongensis TaxID=1007089 RepID=A0ABP8FRL4_9BACT
MNNIVKNPLNKLGYDFIDKQALPKGKDEYYIRNRQNGTRQYRQLSAHEIETLVRNYNTSDDWNKVLVADAFDADLVSHCQFHGLVRIGKLEPYYLEFKNLRLAVGLYNSTISSCDFGDNVVVHNVNYLSHYIIGNEVMLANINEMATTPYAKFGNGILKEGEEEKTRIWLELCNENGGRRILPFEDMLPGDAYLWTRHRDDDLLMQKFREFTEKQFDTKRGYYGTVGDRSVIKNCKIIKDTAIGSDAYIKGANKIKNLTIKSKAEANTQIGEGCELVNGIVGYGCRIFYGVKAVRFIMASHSSLKYGARLINSYLGNNATVSCCEVLNSLIFPAHEQHHNNSFLCAALLMGQSNMAAGATIGSNHNSRGADGEIIAGRGFWPGLCVSLKHNSRFATFTLIAKGNYPAELDLPIPFSLLINDESNDQIRIIPGYWFLYNMYALSRNFWKYADRDKRTGKIQLLEYDYLAPDSVEEMFQGLELMEYHTGRAWLKSRKKENADPGVSEEHRAAVCRIGKDILLHHPERLDKLTVTITGVENSGRPAVLLKLARAYPVFRRMIFQYGIRACMDAVEQQSITGLAELKKIMQKAKRRQWTNVGGQLMPADTEAQLRQDIKSGKIKGWTELHNAYIKLGRQYPREKLQHALASLREIAGISGMPDAALCKEMLQEAVRNQEWISEQIINSRKKDYTNPFRKMVYENEAEMERVMGPLAENGFIQYTRQELKRFKKTASRVIKVLSQ